jgi:hypothetical protein
VGQVDLTDKCVSTEVCYTGVKAAFWILQARETNEVWWVHGICVLVPCYECLGLEGSGAMYSRVSWIDARMA